MTRVALRPRISVLSFLLIVATVACGDPSVQSEGNAVALSPDGTHLGTIRTIRPTANCAFGEEGRVLFMTADNSLLRIRLRS